MSMLGCLNNRLQQMRKMAKSVALRLAEKAKEQKAKELSKEERGKDNNNKNIRNKSTNMGPNVNYAKNPTPPTNNPTFVNKSGYGARKS